MLMLHDRVGITTKRKLSDGRLVVDARFARAGIYEYAGREVDPDNVHGMRDKAVVRVYRPPEEVFDADAMASFAFKAITDDHPAEMVTAENWREHSRGITDGEIKRDGEFVRVPMMIADAGLVAKVDAGKAELSAGYGAELTFGAGFTPGGESYDAVMSGIRGNHIAVVDTGRAGAECRIADTISEGVDDMTVATKTIHFDGLPVVVTDAAEAVINKLQGLLADAGRALETAKTEHAQALAAKDSELGTLTAEVADLKGKVVDGAALDKLVAERTSLVGDVKLIAADLDIAGLDNAALRRAAVAKLVGADAVKDRSDDYVGALFDTAVANAKKALADGGSQQQPDVGLAAVIGDTLPGGTGATGQPGGDAYAASVKRMRDAWKDPQPEPQAA